MSEYSYQAFNKSGEVITGNIEAVNDAVAVDKLEKDGLHPFKIEICQKTVKNNKRKSLARGNKRDNLILFTSQLANLLLAGIQLGEAVKVISHMLKEGSFKDVVIEIYNSLKRGKGFAVSLSDFPRYFSETYVNMVKAGEESGYLGLTCQRMARDLKENKKLRSFIISSLVYPIVLLIVAALAVITLLVFVLPNFIEIYDTYNKSLPWATSILLNISSFISHYGWLMLILLIAVMIGGYSYYQSSNGRVRIDEIMLGMPLFGRLLTYHIVNRITGSLGAMLQSGVPLLKALKIVEQVASNFIYKNALGEISRQVKRGSNLAEAVNGSGVFPDIVIYMIGVGEQTGNLSAILLELADNYTEEYRTSLERLMNLFEPLLILGMGLVIGFIVIAMLLPIMGINTISF